MKKLCAALCAVLLLAGLSACGGNPSSDEESEPSSPTAIAEPEPSSPAFSVEEYSDRVSELKSGIMDETLILGNVGMYEYNYWNAYSDISDTVSLGDMDYEKMVEAAMEWLAENSEFTADTVRGHYDNLISSYIEIVDANIDGEVPDGMSDLVDALFGAYHALYSAVTDPSGEADDFLLQINEHITAVTTFDADLSVMLTSE